MIITKRVGDTLFVSSDIEGHKGMEEVKAELNSFVLSSGIRLDINTIHNVIKDGAMCWYFRVWGKGMNAYNTYQHMKSVDSNFGGNNV